MEYPKDGGPRKQRLERIEMAFLTLFQFHESGIDNSKFYSPCHYTEPKNRSWPWSRPLWPQHILLPLRKLPYTRGKLSPERFYSRLMQQKWTVQLHRTSVPDPAPDESSFLFFLGPIAANAVKLASLCLICASSCCCICICQNKNSSLFFFHFPKQKFTWRWTLTSLAFCFNLSCSGSSCRDRDYVDEGWTWNSWRKRRKIN